MKPIHYIKRFWKISRVEKKLLIQVLFASGLFRIMINVLPLKYILFVSEIGQKMQLNKPNEISILYSKRSLKRIIKFAPWKMNCLINALTLRYMLRRLNINSTVVFSLKKDRNISMLAHAYLSLEENIDIFKKDMFVPVFQQK
jgi:hypothetical protein